MALASKRAGAVVVAAVGVESESHKHCVGVGRIVAIVVAVVVAAVLMANIVAVAVDNDQIVATTVAVERASEQ